MCVLCLSLLHLVFILVGSCERLMDYSILGECDLLWAPHDPKICVHEEYHLELIFQDYLVSTWYVMNMRNSNSRMSINVL